MHFSPFRSLTPPLLLPLSASPFLCLPLFLPIPLCLFSLSLIIALSSWSCIIKFTCYIFITQCCSYQGDSTPSWCGAGWRNKSTSWHWEGQETNHVVRYVTMVTRCGSEPSCTCNSFYSKHFFFFSWSSWQTEVINAFMHFNTVIQRGKDFNKMNW